MCQREGLVPTQSLFFLQGVTAGSEGSSEIISRDEDLFMCHLAVLNFTPFLFLLLHSRKVLTSFPSALYLLKEAGAWGGLRGTAPPDTNEDFFGSLFLSLL